MDVPKVHRKIAVHFQEECFCGEVHTLIHHMKEAEMDVRWDPFELPDFSEGFPAHVEPERKLELSGFCGKVELNGMKWEKGRGVACSKCGINLIYGLIADMPELPKEQEQEGMYFIDNGDCHGAQALERLERPKEQSPNMLHIQINRLDGSCPVQAMGTIEDHSAFYFRGRHEAWQFVAGPKELNTNDLVKIQLKLTQDDRVFVLEGDDEERIYLDYDHVRRCLQTYAQQYIEWMNERRDTNEQEDKEEH